MEELTTTFNLDRVGCQPTNETCNIPTFMLPHARFLPYPRSTWIVSQVMTSHTEFYMVKSKVSYAGHVAYNIYE